MKRFTLIASLAAPLAVAAASTVLASSQAIVGLLSPIVVNVDQAVPVTLTLASTTGVTTTVPLTVGVKLAITLQGAQRVDVAAAAPKTTVAVGAAPASLVDNNGIAYTVEAPDGFTLTSIRSEAAYDDAAHILGELRNDSGEEAEFVKVNASLYDDRGALVDAQSTYLALETIAPGQASTFQIMSDAPFADVAAYKLQIAP